MSQRRSGRHGKPRKRLNRYNPNSPSWRAVHARGLAVAAARRAPAPLWAEALLLSRRSA